MGCVLEWVYDYHGLSFVTMAVGSIHLAMGGVLAFMKSVPILLRRSLATVRHCAV